MYRRGTYFRGAGRREGVELVEELLAVVVVVVVVAAVALHAVGSCLLLSRNNHLGHVFLVVVRCLFQN